MSAQQTTQHRSFQLFHLGNGETPSEDKDEDEEKEDVLLRSCGELDITISFVVAIVDVEEQTRATLQRRVVRTILSPEVWFPIVPVLY